MDDNTLDRRSVLKASGALAGAGALGLLGSSPTAADDDTLATASGNTEPQFELGDPEEFYVDIEMEFENADDEEEMENPTLYGEIVRPVGDDGEPIDDVPVILTYTPYGDLYQPLNDGESPAMDGIAEYFVPRGYARAMFDLIGCRNSDGYYDYGGIRERLSGKELIEGLSEMEWTNGNVGMIGGSYDGTTQLAAAIEQPEGLEAIVPQVAIDRWYDYRYFGGVPRSTVGTPTLFDFGFAAVPPRARDEPTHNVDVTTTRVEPHRRVEHELRSYEYDSVYDEFWEERDYRKRAENVDCAVLMEAGWEDRNVIRWGSTRFYEALAEAGHDERRLVMGDWGHAAGQYPDSTDQYHALYDEFLLNGDESWLDSTNISTGIMDLPPVDVQSESAPRAQFESWPPEGTEEIGFPLVRQDGDDTELELLGTGVASWEDRSPPIEESDMFDERGSDDRHLMFETDPLDEQLRINGRITADLVAASTDDTWYTAVVYERFDDDSVRVFSRGAWNSRFRNDVRNEEATPTNRGYRVGVETWDINWTVSEGSRLGLVIASDNDDHVRHDPTNESTNELLLPESSLRVEAAAGGLDVTTFPSVELSRELDRTVSAAGEDATIATANEAVRCVITADSASDSARVRAPLPDGWEVVAGDDHEIVEVGGTNYIEFDDPIDEDEELAYFAEAPDETDEYSFGPVEYSAAGELWASAGGTGEQVLVVGIDL